MEEKNNLESFQSIPASFSSSLSAAKASFYHSIFQASSSNPRKLFSTFSPLLNPPPPPPLSSLSADDFVHHFEKKNDFLQLVRSSCPRTCLLDPISSSLLQTISAELLPFLTSLINSSMTTGCVPGDFKMARVAPLLKKTTQDPLISKTTDRYSSCLFCPKHLSMQYLNNSLFISLRMISSTPTSQASRRATRLRLLYSM
ncbi:hypothetical protein UPYG_G00021240 [Umbra pygmaea]|uniref:Uncharacterized protein n=1 Tax=Umbra pygmaea TaxID=75934 RepID=A0ABD0XKU1_UMBPY